MNTTLTLLAFDLVFSELLDENFENLYATFRKAHFLQGQYRSVVKFVMIMFSWVNAEQRRLKISSFYKVFKFINTKSNEWIIKNKLFSD